MRPDNRPARFAYDPWRLPHQADFEGAGYQVNLERFLGVKEEVRAGYASER